MAKLSHLDDDGKAHMVDITDKPATAREAVARAKVSLSKSTVRLITERGLPKGDAIEVARLAGIMAAKQTAQLIPLCHPIPISSVVINCTIEDELVCIEARVLTNASTGPEMEAMTAASVAALTLYDMVKSVDRDVEIRDICLLEKRGGKSGHWKRKTQ